MPTSRREGLTRALLFFALSIGVSAASTSHAEGPPPYLTIEEFNQRRAEEKARRYLLFQEDWFHYLKGEKTDLPTSLPPAWVRQATEELLISSGGLKAAFGRASRENTYGFTLTRPSDDPSREASFHRAYQSIFTDIHVSDRNHWFLNFIHEVAHSLDSELRDAIDIYRDPDMHEWLKNENSDVRLEELSPTERARLDRWLLAGLNRGFLAEYRAWLLTYHVYEEGLQDGTFKPDPVWEALKASCPQGTEMRTHLLRTLSPEWVDPAIGPFKPYFIREALKALREKLDANPALVNLGAMAPLIDFLR
jgi:hypothetical protein